MLRTRAHVLRISIIKYLSFKTAVYHAERFIFNKIILTIYWVLITGGVEVEGFWSWACMIGCCTCVIPCVSFMDWSYFQFSGWNENPYLYYWTIRYVTGFHVTSYSFSVVISQEQSTWIHTTILTENKTMVTFKDNNVAATRHCPSILGRHLTFCTTDEFNAVIFFNIDIFLQDGKHGDFSWNRIKQHLSIIPDWVNSRVNW